MIKVLIQRHILEELEELYQQTSRKTLQTAMQARGFISGESLKDQNNPTHRYILASYRSIQDWEFWYHSPERKALMEAINPMLLEAEKITILEHI